MTQEFIKTRSSMDVILSTATLLTGGLLSFIPENVSLQMIGYLLLVIGLILYLTLKSHYRNVESRDLFKKKVRYFDISQKTILLENLVNDPSRIDMSQEGKGSGVILNIYYNGKEAYIQPYIFHSGQYEPDGEMLHFSAQQVEKLIG